MRILTVLSLTLAVSLQAACAPANDRTSQPSFAFTHVTVVDMTGGPAVQAVEYSFNDTQLH